MQNVKIRGCALRSMIPTADCSHMIPIARSDGVTVYMCDDLESDDKELWVNCQAHRAIDAFLPVIESVQTELPLEQ